MSQKGTALYLAIVVMGILLWIGFGVSRIVLDQLKILRNVGNSVIALVAADSGVEKALYCLYRQEGDACNGCSGFQPPFSCTGSVGAASFSVNVYSAGESNPNCPNPPFKYYCIRSVGSYKGANRNVYGAD